MRVRFDRFYTYAELTQTLEAWAGEFPGLMRMDSIGRSFEGREIWLATLTNFASGPPEEKPAVFLQAQIHAMKFAGTTAALHLVDRLLHEYGDDPRVTHVVDTRAFYVVPRVNPDGGRGGSRGWTLSPFERPRLPARRAGRRAPPRGRRRRWPRLADARARSQRPLGGRTRRTGGS